MKKFRMSKGLYMVLAIVVGALLFLFGGHTAEAGVTLATAPAVSLSAEEKEGLDETSQKTLLAIKKSFHQSVEDFKKGLLTKEDVELQIKTFADGLKENELKKLKEMIEGKDDKDDTSIKAILTKQGNMINEIRTKGIPGQKETLLSVVEANKDAIKESATNKSKAHEFTIKADTLRAAITGNANAEEISGIGQLAHRKLTVYDLFRKVPVSKDRNGTVRYVDWTPETTVRAAAAIAEGGVFPSSTAKWQVYTMNLEKVGDSIPMSEELLYDASTFAAELENFLRVNMAIKIDTDLIEGDGASPNMKGLLAYLNAFVPAASGIADASIYDLLVKVREAITKPYGSKYNPDFALMNITDINRMKLKKDENNNYILPPFYDKAGNVVDGITVIECNTITANSMVVGDSRYGAIYEEPETAVTTGLATGDYESDMVTLKARRRMNLLIRNSEKTGFLKITDIDAALVTIATAA